MDDITLPKPEQPGLLRSLGRSYLCRFNIHVWREMPKSQWPKWFWFIEWNEGNGTISIGPPEKVLHCICCGRLGKHWRENQWWTWHSNAAAVGGHKAAKRYRESLKSAED